MTGLSFAVFFGCWLVCNTMPNYDRPLSSVQWDGTFAQFPVNREKLLERLGEINLLLEKPLYLPKSESMPQLDGLGSGQHVVQLALGTEDAVSFEAVMTPGQESEVKPVTHVLGIQIPFLASTEDGSPDYTLQYKVFHPDGTDHIESNVVVPKPTVADISAETIASGVVEVVLSQPEGDLSLVLRASTVSQCTEHTSAAINEYEHEYSLSADGPDFSVCDDFPQLSVDFCEVYRDSRYREVLVNSGNNVCQYWNPEYGVQNCGASFEITDASEEMRDLLMIDGSVTHSINGLRQHGTFESRVVFPCIE